MLARAAVPASAVTAMMTTAMLAGLRALAVRRLESGNGLTGAVAEGSPGSGRSRRAAIYDQRYEGADDREAGQDGYFHPELGGLEEDQPGGHEGGGDPVDNPCGRGLGGGRGVGHHEAHEDQQFGDVQMFSQ